MRTRFDNSGGFTLIELLVTIGLLGLLLVFAIPATVSFMRAGRVSGAAQMVTADVHYARSLATARQRTYKILFRNGTYRVFSSSPAETLLSRTLPSGVTGTATDTVRCYAWGLTSPVTIQLTNGHAASTVTVAANGGVYHD